MPLVEAGCTNQVPNQQRNNRRCISPSEKRHAGLSDDIFSCLLDHRSDDFETFLFVDVSFFHGYFSCSVRAKLDVKSKAQCANSGFPYSSGLLLKAYFSIGIPDSARSNVLLRFASWKRVKA